MTARRALAIRMLLSQPADARRAVAREMQEIAVQSGHGRETTPRNGGLPPGRASASQTQYIPIYTSIPNGV